MSEGKQPIWNKAQLRAIGETGKNMLVSAAAGSGKTSVLSERCVELICHADPKIRCDVNELLVVTFTRAAAAEMRARIENKLRQRAATGSDKRLQRQIRMIDRAEISTLHSFCGNVLRRHFAALEIDPAFTTLDESEARLLQIDVADELFERKYADDSDAQFQELIQSHFGGDDKRLRQAVVRTHQFLCSLVNPAEWRRNAIARLQTAATKSLPESELGRAFLDLLKTHLDAARARGESLQPVAYGLLPSRGDAIGEWITIIDDLSDALRIGGYSKLRTVFDAIAPKRVVPAKDVDEADKDLADSLVEAVRKPIKAGWFASALAFTEDEWREGLSRTAAPAEMFLSLAAEFTQAYTEAKRQLRVVDFADLETLTLRALRDPNTEEITAGAAAGAYREQFKYVLVDEYQDINPLQDQILRLVSRDESHNDVSPNFFCVGDVKQSIYRFRLADPWQFLERAEQYRRGVGGELIALSENFRSDPPILDTVNHIFCKLMTSAAAEIEYDDTHALRRGHEVEKYSPLKNACELHILKRPPVLGTQDDDEEDFDSIEREAFIAADLIQKHTAADASPRFTFGEIAVLLRATKVKSAKFAAVLRRCGIPVYADSSAGLFETNEMRDMLSLLKCLDNPNQDIPLAAVLRSPIARIPHADDAFARVRAAFPEDEFHKAVLRYSIEKLDEPAKRIGAFRKQLNQWREWANVRPIASVLWQIYDESGYLAFVSALPDGRQRVANLLDLHDRARQFGAFQKQGLRRFLEFLNSLNEEADLGLPSAGGDPGNVVRIMSVHQSKGLEFPLVIVPDLGKVFNRQDSQGLMIVDREAGICPSVVDLPKHARWDSLAVVVGRNKIRRQLSAEEMRVLYVALTRAKKKLILTGSVKDPAESLRKWRARWADHPGPLPPDEVLSARSMLDWLGPVAAVIERENADALEVHEYDETQVKTASERAMKFSGTDEIDQRIFRFEPLPKSPPATEAANEALADASWRNPNEAFTKLPAARAITQLTKSGRATTAGESPSLRNIVKFSPPLPMPKFLEPTRAPTPTEAGTATHKVLQMLDFSLNADEDSVRRQLRSFINARSITAHEASAVDVAAIVWFMNSELGRLLRDHRESTHRELPVFAPATTSNADEDPFDRTLLRGQLDVLVQTEAGLVVIDYKTDRITEQTLPERAEFYRPQVLAYCQAMTRITGMPVVAAHLVFLALRRSVSVEVTSHESELAVSALGG